MFTFDQYWLTVTIAVFLPIVVALVTKAQAAPGWKAVSLLLLSVIGGALGQIQAAGGTFNVKETLTHTTVAFIIAVATHFGLLKPVDVTGSAGVVARKVPGGLG